VGSRAGAVCTVVVAAVGGGLDDVPAEGVWVVAVAVTEAVGVEATTLVGAEVTGWDAGVPGMTAKFLAAGLFTIVCSCC